MYCRNLKLKILIGLFIFVVLCWIFLPIIYPYIKDLNKDDDNDNKKSTSRVLSFLSDY